MSEHIRRLIQVYRMKRIAERAIRIAAARPRVLRVPRGCDDAALVAIDANIWRQMAENAGRPIDPRLN